MAIVKEPDMVTALKNPEFYKTNILYPFFNELKAFVLPGAFMGSVIAYLSEFGFKRATTLEEANLVVFTGGSDVNPALYGEVPLAGTCFDKARDEYEKKVYEKCIELKKPMFGICRGAQFLHVMNGGKLWQDVNNHGGTNHLLYDQLFNTNVMANSIHHQMLMDKDDLNIIAVCNERVATQFKSVSGSITYTGNNFGTEIEAGAYYQTQCFFVQGHPEVGSDEYRIWTMMHLLDFFETINMYVTDHLETQKKKATIN